MGFELERCKVVVVGDSGVGKSSLLHLLCHQQPLLNPSYTVGCGLEVKIHQFRPQPNEERPFFIELWDVGGCNAHANARSVFYPGAHGLILVYDCTNSKSQVNLRKWLSEVLQKTPSGSMEAVNTHTSTVGAGKSPSLFNYWSQSEFTSGLRLRILDGRVDDGSLKQLDTSSSLFPVLVIGTKADLLDSVSRQQLSKRVDISPTSRTLSPSSLSSSFECVGRLSGDCTMPRSGSVLSRSASNDSLRHTNPTSSVYINLGASASFSSGSRLLRVPADKGSTNFSADHGFPEIILSCKSTAHLAPNSWNALLLDKFFDDVVRCKLCGTMGYGNVSPESQRSRKLITDLSGGSTILSGPNSRNVCLSGETFLQH
ncbi:Rab-like protein 3 [Clonorchis sinensis]|uniref:Rab-like protein 3 n=1 Tax=Clonorchis sinensis TaxID=79923 RepID=A0A8T1MZ24_CLOSI|nr:Rab-like protein 3 [Clonorchis sinensis]